MKIEVKIGVKVKPQYEYQQNKFTMKIIPLLICVIVNLLMHSPLPLTAELERLTKCNITGKYERLPKFAIPQNYQVIIKPNLGNRTFDGSALIRLKIWNETQHLIFNAFEISIRDATLINNEKGLCCVEFASGK